MYLTITLDLPNNCKLLSTVYVRYALNYFFKRKQIIFLMFHLLSVNEWSRPCRRRIHDIVFPEMLRLTSTIHAGKIEETQNNGKNGNEEIYFHS